MKANELRIGNWVNSRIEVGVFYDVMVTKNDFSGNIDLFKPIPLTKEWLVKLGLKNGFSDLQFTIKVTENCSMSVFINQNGNNCYIGDELEVRIEYVHQLQNLYFALTGEELTIK